MMLRMRLLSHLCSAALFLVTLGIAGCAVGPAYQRPQVATAASYKERAGWTSAMPADAIDRGDWWSLFNDPVLNELMQQVALSNNNIAAASATYAQARALVREQRANLFPVISLNGSGRRTGGDGTPAPGNNFQASVGATWEPDVWGRLSRSGDSADASAAASAADVASATLSARGELAIDYFSLRQTDRQRRLLLQTIDAYQRTSTIAQNRYQAGIAPKTDLLQAQTQLANARADEAGLARTRAQYEHAIAVLVGRTPSDFTLAATDHADSVPVFPAGVPSTLLQRRPDIAAAERRVAVANQQIGIAQTAFYPSLNLSGSYGGNARRVTDLFSVSNSVWSLGLSAAEVLFNAGATKARVSGAEAAQDQAAARYRQIVLSAFQNVEDQLAATQVLEQQQRLREQASGAADEAEAQVLNRYRAGQINFTEVVTAQIVALNARRALAQNAGDRQVTAVALIQALGGGWK